MKSKQTTKDINKLLFFSGNGNHKLGANVLKKLGEFIGERSFQHINFSDFSDNESDTRIPYHERIPGSTVIFYQSIFNAKIMEETLELIWAIKKQYQAAYIIGVFPFLMFRRQDHPEKNHEINRLRMIIDRLHHAGVDEIISVTPHSEMMEANCLEFGMKFQAIDLSILFANTINTYLPREEDKKLIRVYAPDLGSVPRAINLAKLLNCKVIFSLKERGLNNEINLVQADLEEISFIRENLAKKYEFPLDILEYAFKENIDSKIIVMVEDEVSSGSTANNTARKLKKYGAKEIFFLATHPVLSSGWRGKLFFEEPFTKVVMSDTIPRDYEKRTGGKIHDISVASMLAQGIYISLFKDGK